ncbi:MAG: OmpA family protein [Deltaproteobacteria bacterium]|nr:OmpA family protein [Deltaproteobacteria bacterium]
MSQSLFDPAIDTKGHITVDGSPVLPHLRFSLGLLLDLGFNSWVAVEQNDTPIEDEIPTTHSGEFTTIDGYNHITLDRMVSARFQANFGLFNRFAVGLQIPLLVPVGQYYSFDAEGYEDQTHWSNKGTFGDISLHIKASILRSDWHPFGLAFIAQYFIPTGKSELLTGEPGGGAFAFKAILDAEPFSWYRIGFNAGVRLPLGAEERNLLSWHRGDDAYDDIEGHVNGCDGDCQDNEPRELFKYGSSFYFGVGQSITMFPEIMDLVLEFYGNQLISQMGNTKYLSLEASGALKFFIEESSYLMAGYAHGIPVADTQSGYAYQNMEHRMFLGFCYEPSMDVLIRDEDMDRDGDGIPDKSDACPDDPEDLNGIEDDDGCPENDMDGDGIKDKFDRCPLVPEDRDGDRDDDGCPESNEYVGAANAGPSQTSDRDMDRIVDVNDQCPDSPETYNGFNDEDGCPDEGDVVVTAGEIQILKKIYFEYNSSTIKPISYPILDQVAATIINNPQITKIEVQGHADERGKDSYNLKLTKRRARSVKKYLTGKGVPDAKLQSQGYGEYCPIDESGTEKAWEENRRVEFKVVTLNNKPTGIKLGCALSDQKGVK